MHAGEVVLAGLAAFQGEYQCFPRTLRRCAAPRNARHGTMYYRWLGSLLPAHHSRQRHMLRVCSSICLVRIQTDVTQRQSAGWPKPLIMAASSSETRHRPTQPLHSLRAHSNLCQRQASQLQLLLITLSVVWQVVCTGGLVEVGLQTALIGLIGAGS